MGQSKILELRLVCFFCLFTSIFLAAQTNFQSDGNIYPPSNHVLGIVDVNGDFRNDLVIYSAPRNISIFINTLNKGLVLATEINLGDSWDWTFMLGDYQNQNIKSLISSGAYNNTFVSNITSLQTFSTSDAPISGSFLFAQAANSIDINDDGFLDLFICHDDADSHIYLNDQLGQFEKVDDLIDFTTDPISDGSGNYGSIWSYIDGDDKLDLYIAKCRSTAGSSSDPRRINQLYLKNETGSLTRNKEMGLDIGAQSWTADFGDVDNDGDLDAFIVNHDEHHMLMENINNESFVEVQSFSDLNLTGQDIQGIFEDFDNDGLLDMLMVGDNNTIVWNKGDLNFESQANVFPNPNAFSAATGDLNNDGFIDIVSSYALGLIANYDQNSYVYLNQGNDNNFISLSLYGTISNREAVGAKVVCHSNLGRQTRVISSGEGYGIVNSLNVNFGLKSDTSVDSLVIMWPNGTYQHFENIEANQHLVITEDSDCLNRLSTDFIDEIQDLCLGSTGVIRADADGALVNWNDDNQTIGDSITVSESGFYSALFFDELNGCYNSSPTVYIEVIEEEPSPILESNVSDLCLGESLTLTANDQFTSWSTGETMQEIVVTEAGSYFYYAEGQCSELISNTIDINLLAPISIPDSIIVFDPGIDPSVELPDVNTFEWSFDENCEEIIGTGNVIELNGLTTDTTLYVRNVALRSGAGLAGLEIENVGNGFGPQFANPGMVFDMLAEARLNSITVRAQIPAERRFIIKDKNGVEVFSKTIPIFTGISTIELDVVLPAGTDYVLTTDGDLNIENLGDVSPDFSRSTSNINYPYQLDQVARLKGNDIGDNSYYFYYNWDFEVEWKRCNGEKATFFFDMNSSSINEVNQLPFTLHPNPATSYIEIPELEGNFRYLIFDINGKIVDSENMLNSNEINIKHLQTGIYMLKIYSGESIGVQRFVKI